MQWYFWRFSFCLMCLCLVIFWPYWPFACMFWFLILFYYGWVQVCVWGWCYAFSSLKKILFVCSFFICLFIFCREEKRCWVGCVEIGEDDLGRGEGRETWSKYTAWKETNYFQKNRKKDCIGWRVALLFIETDDHIQDQCRNAAPQSLGQWVRPTSISLSCISCFLGKHQLTCVTTWVQKAVIACLKE